MVRWVVGSIPRGGTIDLFLVPVCAPRLECNKGRDMCYPVWDGDGAILSGMVHIEEPLLLIEKSSPCRYPLSLS